MLVRLEFIEGFIDFLNLFLSVAWQVATSLFSLCFLLWIKGQEFCFVKETVFIHIRFFEYGQRVCFNPFRKFVIQLSVFDSLIHHFYLFRSCITIRLQIFSIFHQNSEDFGRNGCFLCLFFSRFHHIVQRKIFVLI